MITGMQENRQYLTRTRSILLSMPPSIDNIIERVRSAIIGDVEN